MTGSWIRSAIKPDSASALTKLPWVSAVLGKTLCAKASVSDESTLTLDIDYDAKAIGKIAWDANIAGAFTSNANDSKGSFAVVSTGSAASSSPLQRKKASFLASFRS